MNESPKLTGSAIADILGVSRQTAWVMLRSGEIANAERTSGGQWIANRQDVVKAKAEMEAKKKARRCVAE